MKFVFFMTVFSIRQTVFTTLQQEKIRMGIAVSRYLKQARNLIWNATEGIFPNTKPATDDVK